MGVSVLSVADGVEVTCRAYNRHKTMLPSSNPIFCTETFWTAGGDFGLRSFGGRHACVAVDTNRERASPPSVRRRARSIAEYIPDREL